MAKDKLNTSCITKCHLVLLYSLFYWWIYRAILDRSSTIFLFRGWSWFHPIYCNLSFSTTYGSAKVAEGTGMRDITRCFGTRCLYTRKISLRGRYLSRKFRGCFFLKKTPVFRNFYVTYFSTFNYKYFFLKPKTFVNSVSSLLATYWMELKHKVLLSRLVLSTGEKKKNVSWIFSKVLICPHHPL